MVVAALSAMALAATALAGALAAMALAAMAFSATALAARALARADSQSEKARASAKLIGQGFGSTGLGTGVRGTGEGIGVCAGVSTDVGAAVGRIRGISFNEIDPNAEVDTYGPDPGHAVCAKYSEITKHVANLWQAPLCGPHAHCALRFPLTGSAKGSSRPRCASGG